MIKRHVPDVLFVDEEGNPIEAGHENLIYVDELGNEIPDEIAHQLLESGKYIDSRDLYLAADANSVGGGDQHQQQHQRNNANNTSMSQVQYDLTQPSLPASAFGSLSKSTGANEMTTMRNKSSKSVQDDGGSETMLAAQARVFAQAQLKMKQREDELREIEADAAVAAAVQAVENVRQMQQQQNKSTSHTDMQKSHSGRRLLQPPPLKTNGDLKSQENLARRLQQQQPQPDRPASSQQVIIIFGKKIEI